MTLMAHRDSLTSLADVTIGARFLRRLPAFLRHQISPDHARATLLHRLERREADFLTIARRAVYEQPGSPYLQLLQLAGCEYGDLERLAPRTTASGKILHLHLERHPAPKTASPLKR